jgi:hypothetical protein
MITERSLKGGYPVVMSIGPEVLGKKFPSTSGIVPMMAGRLPV